MRIQLRAHAHRDVCNRRPRNGNKAFGHLGNLGRTGIILRQSSGWRNWMFGAYPLKDGCERILTAGLAWCCYMYTTCRQMPRGGTRISLWGLPGVIGYFENKALSPSKPPTSSNVRRRRRFKPSVGLEVMGAILCSLIPGRRCLNGAMICIYQPCKGKTLCKEVLATVLRYYSLCSNCSTGAGIH